MPISCRPTSLVLVAILTLTALSTASQAQAPENELSRENERLAAQVRDLEATLKAPELASKLPGEKDQPKSTRVESKS